MNHCFRWKMVGAVDSLTSPAELRSLCASTPLATSPRAWLVLSGTRDGVTLTRLGPSSLNRKFPWAQEFSEGLARVQLSGSQLGIDGKWGFIDKAGAIIIDGRKEPGFGEHNNIGSDSAESAFHNGLALVDVDGKNGYIDRAGKVVIPPQFTNAYPFSEGLAAATKSSSGNGSWGYIDTTGRWVIQPKFQWASSFSGGLAPVDQTNHCGYSKGGQQVGLHRHSRQNGDPANAGDACGGLSSRTGVRFYQGWQIRLH